MKQKCQDCEHRLLSECNGVADNTPDTQLEVCYLENIYGLATYSDYLVEAENAYKKDAGDWTLAEAKMAYIKAVCGGDVLMNGINSSLYPLWNLYRSISVLHCLEIYQMLNVTLTLEHTKGESFYAGIPQVSADDIKMAKKYLMVCDNGTIERGNDGR